jgi:glucan phosphoethanolaminetransferase (alkaline phosphatase superfamily)
MRKVNYPILIAICLLAALFCLAYPLFVIRPFRHQGPGELALALAVIQIRPVVTVLASLVALSCLVFYRRVWAIVAALVVCAATALSHVNVYEKMFHPMGAPVFESVEATKLEGKEMVLAVKMGGAARAYPIRIIAYHHIANDTVGGVPIVATY